MKYIRYIIATLLAFSILFTITVGQYKITDGTEKDAIKEYKGIITIWQVDGFEGGFGSRKQFLLKVARGFEKENDGVLVMVSDYTAQGVKENLENGIKPDMISFSIGTEVKGYSELKVSNGVKGGYIGNKIYATPWCRGGYVLIANPALASEIPSEIESLLVSEGEFTQPLSALALEGIIANEIKEKKPFDAYVEFTAGKTPYFLGTQRDIVRLNNRGFDVISRPLEEYNDLYQYIAITGENQEKRYYAEKFIDYLLSDTVQKSLTDISMMSAFTSVESDIGHLTDMQKASNFQTISAFIDPVIIKEMQEVSRLAVKGDKDALNKIKNMLV